MVVLPKMSKQAHQNQKPLGNFPSGMMFMVARPTVMCISITCYRKSRWVPSRVVLAPFVQRRAKPGREVCSPQAERGSQYEECRVICAQSANRAGCR